MASANSVSFYLQQRSWVRFHVSTICCVSLPGYYPLLFYRCLFIVICCIYTVCHWENIKCTPNEMFTIKLDWLIEITWEARLQCSILWGKRHLLALLWHCMIRAFWPHPHQKWGKHPQHAGRWEIARYSARSCPEGDARSGSICTVPE